MDYLHPWRAVRPWKRHSLALLTGGMLYVVLGLSYILVPLTPQNKGGLHIALEWASIDFWGSVFVFCGILAIISSRWPPISETWGYTVLTALSAGWSVTYMIGIWFYDASLVNWRGVITFGILGFMWWVISGLQNPGEIEALVAKAEALKRENALYAAKLAERERRTE
jgi:hypothetical protein